MILLAFTIPESMWNTFLGALFGGVIASGIVAYLTHRWSESRERRGRRDDLRLELYLEVVDLILNNEQEIAIAGSAGNMPSTDLQAKRLRISHRLKLLGSDVVNAAYMQYRKLVFRETTHPLQDRPRNPNEVVDARERLISAMAKDIQDV